MQKAENSAVHWKSRDLNPISLHATIAQYNK